MRNSVKINNSLVFIVANVFFVMCSTFLFSQRSGAWAVTGSATWAANAGAVGIVATATNYGGSTSFPLNQFRVGNGETLLCNPAFTGVPTMVGNRSLNVMHTFHPDGDINSVSSTGIITFQFSKTVINPIIHLDRLGGGGASGNRTTSSLLRVLNPDVTFTRLSGRGSHFQVSSKTITRESGVVYQSTPSECGGRLNGTAAGSVRVNGIFNQLQLRIEMNPDANAVANDRFEIAFSEVKEFTTDLKLTNVVSASLPKVGETIKYILEITNHGLYDVEGVVVLNDFPSLVTYAGAIGNGSYAPVSGEWNVGDLSIGQKKIIEISGIVNGSGEITSIAEVERVVLATDVDSEPSNSR